MIKTFEAVLLACMILLLFTICGCSDSGPVPEETPEPEVTTLEGYERILTNFDNAQSASMSSFMGGNRALISEGRLWCFEYDGDYAPVLARYELTEEGLSGFTVLAENCVPKYISILDNRLYYINDNGSAAIESIGADGGDRRVLLDEPCGFLQLWDGGLYFCDASGRFCRAELDGSGKTVLIDDICCYTYCFGGWVLYQSGNDGESLHLACLADGKDIKLTYTVSYAPVIIENTLYYTQRTDDGNRIASLELDSGFAQVYEAPLIKGAAEFVFEAGQGWTVRAVPADERLAQSSVPLSKLGSGTWSQAGYSGYRLCDWSGDWQVDAFYENGGRLRSFVLVDGDGGETEYIAGRTRQK